MLMHNAPTVVIYTATTNLDQWRLFYEKIPLFEPSEDGFSIRRENSLNPLEIRPAQVIALPPHNRRPRFLASIMIRSPRSVFAEIEKCTPSVISEEFFGRLLESPNGVQFCLRDAWGNGFLLFGDR